MKKNISRLTHPVRNTALLASTALAFGFAALPGAAKQEAPPPRLICPPQVAEHRHEADHQHTPIRLAQAGSGAQGAKASAAEVAKEVASLLQSCSYDGSPVQVERASLAFSAQGEAKNVVTTIMRFTGLPQNFDVVEGPVPNAAALIVLDKDRIPRRVIAYNAKFMAIVREATANSDWAPVSIMAHEIGHHLSGHTLMPGGSQPPIELEADKFSGFVLQRMGAPLGDALKAMNALVKDGPDGPTHPGRARRVAAITDGWVSACEQGGKPDCRNPAPAVAKAPAADVKPVETKPAENKPAVVATAPVTQPPAAPPKPQATPEAPKPLQAPAPAAAASEPPLGGEPAKAAGAVQAPKPDANAVPMKFSRFIYDEFGILDPATVDKYEKMFFDHAREKGVEIVTLIVKDLHGLTPEDYAQAMLRQLRVGKLDVGNGAVVVIAPEQEKSAVALGSGVMGVLKSYIDNYARSAESFFGSTFEYCKEKKACNAAITDNVLYSSDHVRRDTRHIEWSVRYNTLADLRAAYMADLEDQKAGKYDHNKSRTASKIARITGVIEDADVAASDRFVLSTMVQSGYRVLRARGSEGEHLMLYVLPSTIAAQPLQELTAGQPYSFVARTRGLSHKASDAHIFEVLSFDKLR